MIGVGNMRKAIGIVGGLGPASTAEYYQFIISRYYEMYKDNDYPRILIDSLSLRQMAELMDGGDLLGYAARIVSSVNALEKAGADFVLIASNTPHCVFSQVQKAVKLPLLSIVPPVVAEAKRLGLRRLLLLGTRSTMRAAFYREGFDGTDVTVVVPAPADQEEIHRIIFDELVNRKIVGASRRRVLDIIAEIACDGVILGCTELPLLIGCDDCPLPLLDTLQLHAQTALGLALDEAK